MTQTLERLSPASPSHTRWSHGEESLCRQISARLKSETHFWYLGTLVVISSREWTEYQGKFCWHNHLSVSVKVKPFRRASDYEMMLVRHDFDMEDGEEDNHSPGVARHLFLPLHLPRGTVGVCDCKTDETIVVEPDGYVWSKEVEA